MTNQLRTYIAAAAALAAASILPVKISQYTDISGLAAFEENEGGEDEKKNLKEEAVVRKAGAEADLRIDGRNTKVFTDTGAKETGVLKKAAWYCQEFLEHFQPSNMGAGYTPSVLSLNLTYLFSQPGNAAGMENLMFQEIQRGLCLLNPSHHLQSLGGKLFEKLNEKEQEWMYRIYHDLNQLPYRTSIHLQFLDGDAQADESYTNSQEILSLASVYAYYHSWDDYEATEDYAFKLWELSHQYDISVGSVYYCGGCEEEESGETESVPKREVLPENETLNQEKAAEISAEGQAVQMPSGPASDPKAQTDEGAAKAVENHTASTDSREQSGETVSKENTDNEADSEAAENAVKNGNSQNIDTSVKSENSQNGDVSVKNENSQGTGVSVKTEYSEKTGNAEGEKINRQQIPDISQEMAQQASAGQETGDGENFSGCPGHVDVTVTVRINGLDEKNNLFLLAQGIQETEAAEEESPEDAVYSAMAETLIWPGWNDDTMKAACALADQDWEAQFGFTRPAVSFGKTLTRQEYETYMSLLPDELSAERKSLIAFALDSVGKVPYYYGGKPACPGFGGNNFFSLTSPDTMGRTLKGLDCSGWINWVYWSVLGSPITGAGTSSLAESGRAVTKEELKPGDIAVISGDDAHVVMFLGWDEATGDMICIHESAGNTNNVTVSHTNREWTDYRSLVE